MSCKDCGTKTDVIKKQKTDFQIMVDANNKAIKPWAISLIATNAFWAIVVAIMICLAWIAPAETTVEQDFSNQIQTQEHRG